MNYYLVIAERRTQTQNKLQEMIAQNLVQHDRKLIAEADLEKFKASIRRTIDSAHIQYPRTKKVDASWYGTRKHFAGNDDHYIHGAPFVDFKILECKPTDI